MKVAVWCIALWWLAGVAYAHEGGGAQASRVRDAGSVGADATTVRAWPASAYEPSVPLAQLSITHGRAWWRIDPSAGGNRDRLLLVFHPYSARVTVLAPPDYAPRTQTVFDADLDPRFSRRALAFPLVAAGPIYVGITDARYPLHADIVDVDAHIVADLAHARIISMVTGVLLGICFVVLLFWVMLRERVYLFYAAAMLLQLLYVLCSYGEAYALPGLRWLALFGVVGIWVIATLVTAVSSFFLIELADLQQRAPTAARLLRWVGGYASFALIVALLSPWPADKSWFPSIGNIMLLAANALALGGLTLAFWRGARRAGYALVAWVPLVSLSTARALQLSSGKPLTPWVEYGLPLGLAFAAILLVLVLADRMLMMRRERDSAQLDAKRDALTDVLNRSGIEQRLEAEIANTRRDQVALSALFLDLDHFKHVNDNFGHGVGDDCLRALVRTATAELQYGDHIGRIGGEEFVLVLPGSNRRHARDAAERIRVNVEALRLHVGETSIAFTVSIGVAECGAGDTVTTLVKRCDDAMYAAKRAGRNRVVLANAV